MREWTKEELDREVDDFVNDFIKHYPNSEKHARNCPERGITKTEDIRYCYRMITYKIYTLGQIKPGEKQ